MKHWVDEAYLVEPRLITGELLARAVPGCADAELWADVLCPRMAMAGIESNHDIALFLAHAGHESAGFRHLEESLNYSVESLSKLFGAHRISRLEIQLYGRKPGQKANEVQLGNILYGGSWGNANLGNIHEGDGYRYRGRGIFQLTGRDNYTRCAEATGLDLVNQPDLLVTDPEAAAVSALWFWNERVSGHDVRTTTRQVNGGLNGLTDRIERYKRALQVLEG